MGPQKVEKVTKRVTAEGFTLIEVLIGLAIFSIGILAIAGMQFKSINGNTSARIQTEETRLAVERMERLIGLPYDHADLDPDNNPHQAVAGIYTVVWNVTDADPLPGTKTIRMTVSTGNPNARPVFLNFIKGQGL